MALSNELPNISGGRNQKRKRRKPRKAQSTGRLKSNWRSGSYWQVLRLAGKDLSQDNAEALIIAAEEKALKTGATGEIWGQSSTKQGVRYLQIQHTWDTKAQTGDISKGRLRMLVAKSCWASKSRLIHCFKPEWTCTCFPKLQIVLALVFGQTIS